MYTKSILRISVLIVLSTVAALCIFSEPLEDSTTWFSDFFFTKSLGFGAAYAVGKLYKRWSKTDKAVKAYDKWCEKNTDAPNPMYIGE